MLAIIMAGGEGTRLRPLTCRLPKPMVPIMGRPAMAYSIEHLRRHGFHRITATLMYRPEEITAYFGDQIGYFIEETPLGTAGGVKAALPDTRETLLVTSGDALTDIDFTKALAFHKERGAMATLVLKRVENPTEFGVVVTAQDGRVERFLEKPGAGEVLSDTINTGIYLLEPEALARIPQGNYDFGKDLFPALVASGAPVYGYVAQGYWCDVGDITTYMRAHCDALEGKISFIPKAENGIYIHEDARVATGARLQAPCHIGAGAVVHADARIGPYTVLGQGTTLHTGASAVRSVLWEGAILEAGAEARGALLMNGARMEAGAQAYEGAVLGERSTVGKRAVLSSGALIWPQKHIEDGMRVSGNVVWGGGSTEVLRGRGAKGGLHLLTPGECVALGAAVAAACGPSCAVADQGTGSARMAADAFCTGFAGAGGRVYRLGTASPQSVLYSMRRLELSAGCAVRTQGGELVMDLYAAPGSELPVNMLRKCKQAFARRDGAPVSPDAIPMPVEVRGVHRQRCADFAAELGVRESTSIALSIECSDAAIAREAREMLTPYARLVEQSAAIHAHIAPDGEQFTLRDEQGNITPSHRLPSLFTWAIQMLSPGADIVVPSDASTDIEQMAKSASLSVHRPHASRHAMLEYLSEGDPLWRAVYFDAAGALLMLVQALHRTQKALSEVLAELSSPNIRQVNLALREGEKAATMRRLIERTRGMDVVVGNGIRLESEYGWALMLPSEDSPEFRVICEAYSSEAADELAGFCIDLIRKE